jgi:hypothetical protein
MALRAESAKAMISMKAITQLRNSPASPGNTLPAKVTKMVFASASEASESAWAPRTTRKAIGTRV